MAYNKPKNNYHNNNKPKNKYTAPSKPAEAPYNFISLPNQMIKSPLQEALGKGWQDKTQEELSAAFKQYIRSEGKNSGEIQLTITTKSPFFIGGTQKAGEKDKLFFNPAGQPTIPGSSIRGMIKNIFKIVTCGAMRGGEDITEKHLYFRGLAASNKKFREYYAKRMTENKNIIDKDGNKKVITVSKAEAGFLIKSNKQYYICPADEKREKYFPPNGEKAGIRWDEHSTSATCMSGGMRGKKHRYVISKADFSVDKRLPVAESIINDYRDDISRKGFNVLTGGKKGSSAAGFTHCADIDYVVPCHYLAQNGQVMHFGFGPYYRIPYEQSIAAHIPEAVRVEKNIDFADAVFGRKEYWGSRVFFEDAPAVKLTGTLPAAETKPLMTPRPTSFQLYLVQKNQNDLQHWDNKANIRGYKQYWHQGNHNNSWQKDVATKSDKLSSRIAPLKAGSVFEGKIRFENLTDLELGALLRVLNLNAAGREICYKLGGGKPLGLGSVSIDSKVMLIDKGERYKSLFAGSSWQAGSKEMSEADIEALCSQLDNHVGSIRMYQDIINTLTVMMDWKQSNNNVLMDKMHYMMPNDKNDCRLKDRIILPTPEQLVK